MIITIQYYISHDTFSSKMAGNPALPAEDTFSLKMAGDPALPAEDCFINGTAMVSIVTRFSLDLKAF